LSRFKRLSVAVAATQTHSKQHAKRTVKLRAKRTRKRHKKAIDA
jgi:hypothetical protein